MELVKERSRLSSS